MDSKVTFVMSGAVVGGGTGGAVEEKRPQAVNPKGKKSGKVRGCADLYPLLRQLYLVCW